MQKGGYHYYEDRRRSSSGLPFAASASHLWHRRAREAQIILIFSESTKLALDFFDKV